MTIVVVGGGPTGVELAGAFAELTRTVLHKDFDHIDPTKARVILIEGGPRVLGAFPPELSASAQRQLEKLGVDVIEAGFAASSEGDFDSVRRVCKEVSQPRVVSLARAQQGDIERALKAVEAARPPATVTGSRKVSR